MFATPDPNHQSQNQPAPNRFLMQPEKGSLAICGIGCIGIVTSDSPEIVQYSDGSSGVAWTGVQVFPNPGAPWSSRNPICIDRIENLDGLPGEASQIIDDLSKSPSIMEGDLYRAIVARPEILTLISNSPALDADKSSIDPAQYEEQELTLGDDLVSAVYLGDETLTFRCGDKYKGDAYHEGPCTLVTPEGVRIPVVVTEATGKSIPIKDLTADQIRRNGFPISPDPSVEELAAAHQSIADNMSHWYPHLNSDIDSEIFVIGFTSPEQTPILKILRAAFEQAIREELPQANDFRFEFIPSEDPESLLPRVGVEFSGENITEEHREQLLKRLGSIFDADHCFEEHEIDVEVMDDDHGWEFGSEGSGFFIAFGEPLELLHALVVSRKVRNRES